MAVVVKRDCSLHVRLDEFDYLQLIHGEGVGSNGKWCFSQYSKPGWIRLSGHSVVNMY